MKIISQLSLFDDTFEENLGDLFRLQTILAALPDEKLIQKLQKIYLNIWWIQYRKICRAEMNGLLQHCGIHLLRVLFSIMTLLPVF